MRVYDNGIYRDLTAEEIAEIEALQNQDTPSEPTLEERVDTLEENTEALKIILGVDS